MCCGKEHGSLIDAANGAADGLTKAFLIMVVCAFGGSIAMAVLHILTVVAMWVGLLVMGFASTYGGIRFYAWRRRRLMAMDARVIAGQMPYKARQQVGQPRQALPSAEVHHHHGHTLALPGDWSPEQIRAFRGEQ